MSELKGVSGQGIIVTGGGGGVGSAMATELCRLGARVVVCGRTEETLQATVSSIEAELGEGVAFLATCDVRDPESVTGMVDAAEQALGEIDGLVNNASGMFPIRAEELTPNGFQAVTSIVLNGTFHCSTELGGRWLAAGKTGSIVNVLTPYAWMGGPGMVHNAAAKGGVLNMTRTLAVEWASRGVRVNAVAPGWMPVGGTKTMVDSKETEARLIGSIPAGRLLQPEETARAVAYLLSDDASYITGHCLTIDGGHHLSKGFWEFLDDMPERSSE